ncbi:F-box protein-like protein [Salvia divinorum]|uniref:F-box protein-like protein n=1 Tax=Salvia divinorum TaxID=28513 RepID=A0ABD1HN75_SALDI
MKAGDNSKMGEDFFKHLPSEIVVEILSRLPTRAAMACKCVCKSWLGLLATPEFVDSHVSRSAPGIAVATCSNTFEIIEFVDELDEDHFWDVAFEFKLPFDEPIHSSVNGLTFLRDVDRGDLILCNPITRDYIKLPCPPQTTSAEELARDTFGFGVSRTTGQYKVVRVFNYHDSSKEAYKPFECQVYTVGTGLWRNVPSGSPPPLWFFDYHGGVLLNGNLHLMAKETTADDFAPSVLRDCLCLSHITADGEIVIWLMKEYGEDDSWTREVFVCKAAMGYVGEQHVWPIRVFQNGDILMEWEGKPLYYSNETKAFDYDISFRGDPSSYVSTTAYASSLVSLKNFVMENVSSF